MTRKNIISNNFSQCLITGYKILNMNTLIRVEQLLRDLCNTKYVQEKCVFTKVENKAFSTTEVKKMDFFGA